MAEAGKELRSRGNMPRYNPLIPSELYIFTNASGFSQNSNDSVITRRIFVYLIRPVLQV